MTQNNNFYNNLRAAIANDFELEKPIRVLLECRDKLMSDLAELDAEIKQFQADHGHEMKATEKVIGAFIDQQVMDLKQTNGEPIPYIVWNIQLNETRETGKVFEAKDANEAAHKYLETKRDAIPEGTTTEMFVAVNIEGSNPVVKEVA